MEPSAETAILLLSCPDQKGIVAEIASFIYQYSGNIIHSDQHTDFDTNTFFMRIEWELKGFQIPKEKIADAFSFIAAKFKMEWGLHFSTSVMNMSVFVSKLDHCLYDILLRRQSGEFRVNIPLILSNHEDLKPVAGHFGVEFLHVPVNEGVKADAERRQLEALAAANTDFIVLARYMQVLSGGFISRYKNRIINIHHSFLPAFVGAKPYHQAFQRGVKIIGATSHFATEDLDNGPIIEQDVVKISHRDSLEDLMQKGKELEKTVLGRAVRLYLGHKVLVSGNKTVIFD